MIVNCPCEFDWILFLNGVSALATLGAFILGIIIARNISFKKELRKKQLDTVFDLVNDLQKLEIFISALVTVNETEKEIITSYSADTWFHFFGMKTSNIDNIEYLKKGNPTLYVSEDFLFNNPIFKYINNPFLPKSIALKLINIYHRGGEQIEYIPGQSNSAYLSDDRDYKNHVYIREISNSYKSFAKLFQATEDLNISIKRWLKKNGVDGLNLRDNYINLGNYS